MRRLHEIGMDTLLADSILAAFGEFQLSPPRSQFAEQGDRHPKPFPTVRRASANLFANRRAYGSRSFTIIDKQPGICFIPPPAAGGAVESMANGGTSLTVPPKLAGAHSPGLFWATR
jgi:hypothetical protein